jgi:alpha-N-arabinofuranosidase
MSVGSDEFVVMDSENGDPDKRPLRRELVWNGLKSNEMGIDDFMSFCRLLGAEPYIIAVNSGLGDAHSAAEEV